MSNCLQEFTDREKALAFDLWMEDYVNNPSEFEHMTATAMRFVSERNAGVQPTYGQVSVETLRGYCQKARDYPPATAT